ncbi:uncharacterized protein LOC105692965 isoform X1 [Athalia rosae]|uniref:uncharacterized protein LOC105692965 isoform X1 n=2 Tax=Athalia rosae TaxID=37344 RepID=UPI0020346105|nr:uncharacterized protein LOC105692965 isoform X1 [Athalia rosae]
MISSIVSRLVILVFGTLYPAYASYKAVRTKNVKEYVKWMMYWIVFALFTCAETFTDVFLSFWFPFYYEIKIILVLWLLSPATKGSSILYRRFVHPALSRREAEIDEALARATEQGYTAVLHLGSRGVNYATTVLMQTAIKGGGGLVQQLKKSYSLSDLTGEKEDENRNTPDTRDEIDMQAEPRRRENPGRRGYSPRRTQSGSNRVDMYFSEVDVDVRQPRPREPIASLSNIRSSDDISSGYSSGEALHPSRVGSQVEPLVRTSSVGARTRPKPRSTTRKVPEDSGDEASDVDPSSYPRTPVIPPYSQSGFLSAEQALDILLAFAQNSPALRDALIIDHESIKSRIVDERIIHARESPSYQSQFSSTNANFQTRDESSDKESSSEFLDSVSDADNFPSIDDTPVKSQNVIHAKLSTHSPPLDESKSLEGSKNLLDFAFSNAAELSSHNFASAPSTSIDVGKITNEICQSKFDELKELISSARKAVSNIISSEDINVGKKIESNMDKHLLSPASYERRSISRSNSDSCYRAGKYNKKPAPKIPGTKSQDDLDSSASQGALKATLVIKTGTVKTVTSIDASKDVFVSSSSRSQKFGKNGRRSKAAAKTKEGLSKLLTIPKTIFNTAFHHKDHHGRDCDSNYSPSRTPSRSRSVSLSSREEVGAEDIKGNSNLDSDFEDALLKVAALDEKAETYVDLRSNIIDDYASDQDSKSEDLDKTVYEREEYEEKVLRGRGLSGKREGDEPTIPIRQMSRSPTRIAKKFTNNGQ